MHQTERDSTTAKERISSDKINSLASLLFGSRALQFNAFLKQAPSSAELTALATQAGSPAIHNAIFDLDGTLVPPYAPIPDQTISGLTDYLEDGRNVGIYTNSPHSERLDGLREAGIAIAETGIGKPSLEGFKRFCDSKKMDPGATAMIGNFPITDMPLVPEGELPFFPLNILVQSIPPEYRLIGSLTRYLRARLFHCLNVTTAGIVLARNRNLIKEVTLR